MRDSDKGKTATLTRGGQSRKSNTGGAVSYGQDNIERNQSQYPAHGQIRGRAWIKRVRKSQHVLRIPYGWALDVADLEAAEACGAQYVELREQEERRVYRAGFDVLRAKGVPLNRGCGEQLALSMGNWTVDGKAPSLPVPADTQLGLGMGCSRGK